MPQPPGRPGRVVDTPGGRRSVPVGLPGGRQLNADPLASQKRCALGINAEWQDESGGALASILDPRNLLARALRSVDLSRTLCTRFIDPYGDTVFNQAQIPVLLQELRDLCTSELQEEAKEHLRHVISIVARAQGETHTYIKFIGD